MIIDLNNENFDKEIENGLVLVDFYATWCGPCKMMHPVLDDLSNNNHDLKIIKVDTDKYPELARNYAVMSIPTIILFNDGQIINKNVGFTPIDILNSWINDVSK